MLAEQQSKLAGAEIPPGLSNEISAAKPRDRRVVDGFRWVMLVATGLLVSALIAALMIKVSEHQQTD